MEKILRVLDLHTTFKVDGSTIYAVKGVSLEINEGETLCIVGESGSGKSVTGLSIMQLFMGTTGRIENGQIFFKDIELTGLPEEQIRNIRGNKIAMVFQEPMTSQNPVLRIGRQLTRTVQIHKKVSKAEARERGIEALKKAGIRNPEDIFHAYPQELSGGMRQRVMIAQALINRPALLLCDEPTSALDAIVQAQIVQMLRGLSAKEHTAILFITHDMSVVAQVADRVAVMYFGEIVESAPVKEFFANPQHPYSIGLIRSIPQPGNQQRLQCIKGSIPRPTQIMEGCIYLERCPFAREKCKYEAPLITGGLHQVKCFYPYGGKGSE